jgi:hypothetical protein
MLHLRKKALCTKENIFKGTQTTQLSSVHRLFRLEPMNFEENRFSRMKTQ